MSIVTQTTSTVVDTRQGWLESAFSSLTDHKFPERVRIGINNSSRALANNSRAGVLVRDKALSNDGTWEIFIDPRIENPLEVLHLVAEGAARVAVGLVKGTNQRHQQARVNMGLGESTLAPRLNAKCQRIIASLPDYSTLHAGLNDEEVKQRKDGTRQLKFSCNAAHADGEGEYIVRLSNKQAERGAPLCGACAEQGDLTYMVEA